MYSSLNPTIARRVGHASGSAWLARAGLSMPIAARCLTRVLAQRRRFGAALAGAALAWLAPGPAPAQAGGARLERKVKAALLVKFLGHSEFPAFALGIKIVDKHKRFDVSLEAAKRSQVKPSSRLLTVADHVVRGEP